MRDLKQYQIRFTNLKPGTYEYFFEVDPGFFENFKNSLLTRVWANVRCMLHKEQENLFHLEIFIEGQMNLNCSRCLDELDYPFRYQDQLLIKLIPAIEEKKEDDAKNILYLPFDEEQINIAQPVYEFIHLSLPMKIACELTGKECNQEMINILNKMKSRDKNKDPEEIDPRWNKLKNLSQRN